MLDGPDGRKYIGVTSRDARWRFWSHCSDAKRHRCGFHSPLYNALRKHGKEAFSYRTLVVGEWDYILDLEDKAIAAFDTMSPNGYNVKRGGFGGAVVGEGRERQIAANRRITSSPEWRAKHSAIHKAKWSDPAYRMKMMARPKPTAEQKAKARAGAIMWNKTIGSTPEHRAKLSASITAAWARRKKIASMQQMELAL